MNPTLQLGVVVSRSDFFLKTIESVSRFIFAFCETKVLNQPIDFLTVIRQGSPLLSLFVASIQSVPFP
jgi:hypothetical protein